MKACGVSGTDGDVVLLELPDPPSPGPGQILVAVEAAGVGAWDGLLNGAGWDVGLRPPAALGAAALPVNGLTAWQALAMLGLGRGQRLLVTNGAGNTGSLAIQLAAAMGVEVTATASAAATDRLRGLGAAQVVDYHDLNWPDQVHGRFDGALTAAVGTAAAALPLVRDGGRLCS